MAPISSPKKVPSNEDIVKTGSILDKERFLWQHDHYETNVKIMKAFVDSGLMKMITFDLENIYKKEVVEFYVNAITWNGKIKCTAGEIEVIITTEDIRTTFDPLSHNYNEKEFWDEIRHETTLQYEKFSQKKKILLKPVWEKTVDIIYKCLECKIVGVDEITTDEIAILHAIISGYKCDWAKHSFNYLGVFITKSITPGLRVF